MKQFYKTCRCALLPVLLGSSLYASAQSALRFNGTTSYAQTTLTSLTGTAVSLECWVKVAAFKTGTANNTSGVIGMESGYDAALLRFGDAGIAGDKLQFVLGVQGDHQKVTSTNSLMPNTWYHIAGTFDGTTMRLYVNGVLNNSLTITGPASGADNFVIGRDYDNTRVLNGTVDEVRVWTRTLTAAEISANSCSVSTTAPGLAGYWRLNEGTGTIAADASPGNHPATLNATTAWTTAYPVACGGPLAIRSSAASPRVQLLGNPALGNTADLELTGVQSQSVTVRIINILGAVVAEQQLRPSTSAVRTSLTLPATPGLYLVCVSTPDGATTTRLLKQ